MSPLAFFQDPAYNSDYVIRFSLETSQNHRYTLNPEKYQERLPENKHYLRHVPYIVYQIKIGRLVYQ
ncbi:hypothetical protein SAMN00120144_0244 [Hymenobacter roseosalivarius DSM 11622]|uniref:Uncharacterized protein n=1 Tax=Hymenobacter roseosalivarius DSM 11622 TaxID=645990 RepID=A0A1W1W1M4_9BACT|nr:hypothetical protein SAMN00120144_0244 [Hymenobacter roseosalivarius DSM 11622]